MCLASENRQKDNIPVCTFSHILKRTIAPSKGVRYKCIIMIRITTTI